MRGKTDGWGYAAACALTAVLAAVSGDPARAATNADFPHRLSRETPEEHPFDLAVTVDLMSGESEFTVGGWATTPTGGERLQWPLSRVEFPLDVKLLTFHGAFHGGERFRAQASVGRTITDEAGTTRAYDWGVRSSDPSSLDVYSTSRTLLKATLVDVHCAYRIWSKPIYRHAINSYWAVDIGLGYLYREMGFDVSRIDQWSPSEGAIPGSRGGHEHHAGHAMKHDMTYRVPYAQIAIQERVGAFHVELAGGYSPLTEVTADGRHMVRGFASDGRYDGDAAVGRLSARYSFHPQWYLRVDANYLYVAAKGDSTITVGGLYDHEIETEIRAHMFAAGVGIGCRF